MFCVSITTNPVRKMIFRLKVDEYSTLMLKGSQKMTTSASQPVYAWVGASQTGEANPLNCDDTSDMERRGAVASCPQIYTSSSHVAFLLNLVVNLDNGKVSSFAWDNGCAGCGPSSCMESSKRFDVNKSIAGSEYFKTGVCGQDTPKCPPEAENSCDMKILVTWAGTDKDGNNLLSAGLRLSKFTGHTLRSVYDTMSDNYANYA